MGCNFQNASPIVFFIESEPNFMIKKAVIKEYKVLDVLAICRKMTKKKCDTLKF